ncbi:MAG: FKBP-type peptidyl-prolyl cis-trans isomerase N-terminal domain-containing protein [Verrucomicrobiaceae bacterium]
MKIPLLSLALLAIPLLGFAQEEEQKEKLSDTERQRRVSIALGFQAGMRAKQKQVAPTDISLEQFSRGFEIALRGEQLPFSPEELREAFDLLQKQITQREADLAKTNLKAQEKFLSENGKKEGVVKLKSGLQYLVLDPGKEKAKGSIALAHYRGMVESGEEFDASDGETPSRLKFDELISGFREALSLMPLGARWRVFVPSELAYGSERRSHLIGPNQLLIFEIDLVALEEEPEESAE